MDSEERTPLQDMLEEELSERGWYLDPVRGWELTKHDDDSKVVWYDSLEQIKALIDGT